MELPPPATKKCSKCGIEKPLTDFYKDNARPDGLSCYCKQCRKIMNAQRDRRKKVDVAVASVSLNPDFKGIPDRELQSQAKVLLNELRARGWQVECSISFLQTKTL